MSKTINLSEKFINGLSGLYKTVKEVRIESKITLYLETRKGRVNIIHDYGGEDGCTSVVMSLDARMVEAQADIKSALLFKELLKGSV